MSEFRRFVSNKRLDEQVTTGGLHIKTTLWPFPSLSVPSIFNHFFVAIEHCR